MRFGIGMMKEHTLEEIGSSFRVTRERVRQIEAKALKRLQTPQWMTELESALDD
jgi:RNA polymerase primary sigma factor